jgi:hypothetical protein
MAHHAMPFMLRKSHASTMRIICNDNELRCHKSGRREKFDRVVSRRTTLKNMLRKVLVFLVQKGEVPGVATEGQADWKGIRHTRKVDDGVF